jgi:hypothetical protein
LRNKTSVSVTAGRHQRGLHHLAGLVLREAQLAERQNGVARMALRASPAAGGAPGERLQRVHFVAKFHDDAFGRFFADAVHGTDALDVAFTAIAATKTRPRSIRSTR